jgi:hypothetical protein
VLLAFQAHNPAATDRHVVIIVNTEAKGVKEHKRFDAKLRKVGRLEYRLERRRRLVRL